MDIIDYAKGNGIRSMAGASAIGLLSAMVSLGSIPPVHRARAVELVEEWDHAFDPPATTDGAANVD